MRIKAVQITSLKVGVKVCMSGVKKCFPLPVCLVFGMFVTLQCLCLVVLQNEKKEKKKRGKIRQGQTFSNDCTSVLFFFSENGSWGNRPREPSPMNGWMDLYFFMNVKLQL